MYHYLVTLDFDILTAEQRKRINRYQCVVTYIISNLVCFFSILIY